MSHLKYHRKVNNAAYLSLKERLKKEYFPKKSNILVYNTILSPDTIHVFKHVYGFESFNHLNSETYNGAYSLALKHYKKLVKSLKIKKGAFSASWLGHFIVDCLEPMHLFNWKVEDKKNRRQNLRLHAWTEMSTRNIKAKEQKIIDIKEPVSNFIKKKSSEIKNIEIKRYYPKQKKKILNIYEEKITPIHVQAVASIWYKAVCEANEKK